MQDVQRCRHRLSKPLLCRGLPFEEGERTWTHKYWQWLHFVPFDHEALTRKFERAETMLVVFEVGTHSPEEPTRFTRSREVGPFLGLVPRLDQSGEQNPQRRITRAGDDPMRRLLVGSAHYILGPFGPHSDLRRHGLKISTRGGTNAKKRAAVAVARKLAVLLHHLWITGEVYQPFMNGPDELEAAV